MSTTLTKIALEINGSTTVTATNSTTNGEGVTIAVDNMSNLIIRAYNSDTNAATVAIAASDSIFTRKGVVALSTSVAASGTVYFGPFESAQYKSSSATLIINTTSTESTNISWEAVYIPKALTE